MAIDFVSPRPYQDPDLEVNSVVVERLPAHHDGRIVVAFITNGGGQEFTMPQEVFDKLAIAVVKFVQAEAVAKSK
jgi:hypothetical protein